MVTDDRAEAPECEKCHTDHEGYPPGTLGAEMRCLRAQAVALGSTGLVDRIDAGHRYMEAARDAVLRAEGLIPDVD